MSWLGLKARMDYLPIAQEYLRKLGFKVNVDLIDNALVVDYLWRGMGPRVTDFDFFVSLKGSKSDPGNVLPLVDVESPNNAGLRGWPFEADPETKEKEGAWVFGDTPRMKELVAQAYVEADPQKRVEIYQEIDCIWNEEMPILTTAAASYVAGKSKRLQGVEWDDWSGLGFWVLMYKPGDWWVWEQ